MVTEVCAGGLSWANTVHEAAKSKATGKILSIGLARFFSREYNACNPAASEAWFR
jgi:hypothetical protein